MTFNPIHQVPAPSPGDSVRRKKPDTMTEEELLKTADEHIRAHRTVDAEIVIHWKDKALRGADLTIEQTRHEFLFGCNLFMLGAFGEKELNQLYLDQFSALLNYATLPFYWGSYEPIPGQPHAPRLEQMAGTARAAGIELKGHPLIWHLVPCKWWPSDLAEFERLAEARVRREVGHFAGLIDRWDVVNEAVVAPAVDNTEGHWMKELGPAEAVARALKWARTANPNAQLLVNDFRLDKDYVKLLTEVRQRGGPFDAIGLQSHMHTGNWPLSRVWAVCEQFRSLGVPLHFTELTVLSGKLKTDNDWMSHHPNWNTTPPGELAQADYVESLYTLLFSHPAVSAISWWDFTDRGAWQGAPAGLIRSDLTPKPAYDRLLQLVKGKWWTKITAEGVGRLKFRGYLGEYRATVKLPDGRTARNVFRLNHGHQNRFTIAL